MVCKKCGSNNMNVVSEQVGSKTKKKKMGFIYGMVRAMLILCTCGLWLVMGKKSGTEKTSFNHKTVAICQSCGNKQNV